jgi:hypothetical protein
MIWTAQHISRVAASLKKSVKEWRGFMIAGELPTNVLRVFEITGPSFGN